MRQGSGKYVCHRDLFLSGKGRAKLDEASKRKERKKGGGTAMRNLALGGAWGAGVRQQTTAEKTSRGKGGNRHTREIERSRERTREENRDRNKRQWIRVKRHKQGR